MAALKVMTIFGTCPEAIKMAPIIKALEKDQRFESIVVVTAQHRQMLDAVLELFAIKPDVDLNIMRPKQTLTTITTTVLSQLDQVICRKKPDIILVHGDTTTTLAASLAAYYHQIKLGHVEAGLRTWQKYSPFPEEMNRQLVDVLADIYFVPTKTSQQNLLQEHHTDAQIYVTGNTVIDALKTTVDQTATLPFLKGVTERQRLILLTMHRRENQGLTMRRIFKMIRQIIDRHPDTVLIYPVHLNPAIQSMAQEELGNHERIQLIKPLEVDEFHNLMARCYLIMTDSGGVQEEAPALGVPVLVLRETTERPEGVAAGTLRLVGTQPVAIEQAVDELLTNQVRYQEMAHAQNPYGDGRAAERILTIMAREFDLDTFG